MEHSLSKSNSSASSKVFALPELLTLIIKYVSWYELWWLQRVNKTLQSVISSIPNLQDKLLLTKGHLSTWPGQQPISPLLSSNLHISFGPFYRVTDGLGRCNKDDCILNFSYTILGGPRVRGNGKHEMGICFRKNGKYDVLLQGLWKCTRITNVKRHVLITIEVKTEGKSQHVWMDEDLCNNFYTEYIVLDAQLATLGDLAEVLFQLHDRKWQDHVSAKTAGNTPGLEAYHAMLAIKVRQASKNAVGKSCVSWNGNPGLILKPSSFMSEQDKKRFSSFAAAWRQVAFFWFM